MYELKEYDLKNRLVAGGISPRAATHIARGILHEFNLAVTSVPKAYEGHEAVIVEIADAVTRMREEMSAAMLGMRKAVIDSARPRLPSRPPLEWRRDNRLPNENAIQFLRRVWGPYIDAGLLHQDTLEKLGEGKLLAAVRSYCKDNRLQVGDYLPPKWDRLRDARAVAAPGTPEYKARANPVRRNIRRQAPIPAPRL